MDFITKHTYKYIAFIGIVILFICSCCNHCSVNRYSQINIELLSKGFEETKANIEIIKNSIRHGYMQKKYMGNVSKELITLLANIEKAKGEITKQYQNIFDANTVTFLITFLSALFFTLFVTYITKNINQFIKLYELNEKLNKQIVEVDNKITKADMKIDDAGDRIVAVDHRIAEAKKDWDIKLQYQEYMLKLAIERNNLTQILNLISVLGSHLASSDYIIKPEYATLVYMTHRKTQSLLKEGFKDIKTIRQEDKTELKK